MTKFILLKVDGNEKRVWSERRDTIDHQPGTVAIEDNLQFERVVSL
jgi:hypothetical protein